MNVESLKTELQQVLDNDVVLRKEFNELKRSLSDYRNQLIMRDEDCKRLQVTIDVLNTKLVVMERDNTNYKAELTSFKELRGSIKEQLQEKQDEIDARLGEIQNLKDDLNSVAASYEQRIEELKNESNSELERVRGEYIEQINELKSNAGYKENGLRDEYENRISELSMGWSDKEHSLLLNHEEEVVRLKSDFETTLTNLKVGYEQTISNLSSGTRGEIDAITETHQATISGMEIDFNTRYSELQNKYTNETSSLRAALEEQRSTLTTNFNSQIENLSADYLIKENQLIASYEQQLENLKLSSSSSSEEATRVFTAQLEELKISHETLLNETTLNHQTEINSVISGYEEKLSHALIHSNAQNTKLTDELTKVQGDFEGSLETIRELSSNLELKDSEISNLSMQLANLELQLVNETNKLLNLNNEFENFKQHTLLSNSEQVNELNTQIANLNIAHSDYVNELTGQIDSLNGELKNIGLLFESTTNSLSETELALENKIQELAKAELSIDNFKTTLINSSRDLENFRVEIQNNAQQEIENKEIEFQKLLVENSSLINEIDLAQDRIETQEAELILLKAELESIKEQTIGKTEDFKETISIKNFEITNLEANNAALTAELALVKEESAKLQTLVNENSDSITRVENLQSNLDEVREERSNLLSEITSLQLTVSELNASILGLNEKVTTYETEIEHLKGDTKLQEQEFFIDRLFKQIDGLNDERLALLNEKEQMAVQLLKMNDVVGSISQQVDSEKINVTDLNNHRKNVILATHLGENNESSPMKQQINDLVREIDKCIALLSA